MRALRFRARRFLRFHERHQIRDRFLHHARALHDLRQKHFPGSEQIADHTHPGHERTFDDIERPLRISAALLRYRHR